VLFSECNLKNCACGHTGSQALLVSGIGLIRQPDPAPLLHQPLSSERRETLEASCSANLFALRG
jgi:hypothetical protein